MNTVCFMRINWWRKSFDCVIFCAEPKRTEIDMTTDDDDDDILGAPKMGHNNPPGTIAASQLKTIIERLERLDEEKKATLDDIKEVYAEAKANGFDPKTIRKVLAHRKKPTEELQEEEALLDLYLAALGMLPEV